MEWWSVAEFTEEDANYEMIIDNMLLMHLLLIVFCMGMQ